MSPKSTDKTRRHKKSNREESPSPSTRRHKKRSREEPPAPSTRRHKKRNRKETGPPSNSALPTPSIEVTSQSGAVELFPPWIDLPSDITCNILQRIGTIDILENVQKVCSTWYTALKNPAMWRVVDMYSDDDDIMHLLEEMCRRAVDRSEGQLVEINLDQLFSNDELIDYISSRCGNLRRLKLVSYFNSPDGGVTEEMLRKFPKLESLDVAVYTKYYSNGIEMVASTCPLLTSFALKKIYFGRSSFNFHTEAFGSSSAADDEADAIARSMPNLRHLQLIENNMTTHGLKAILDSCRRLESLVLHRCFFLKLEEESDLVERMSSQIKDVKCTECTYPEHLKEINWHDM